MADEALGWFMQRLVTQAEGAEMHWHECFCIELDEGIDRLLGVHVHISFRGGVVGSDGEECDFHRQPLADFCEALEIRAVTTMENRAPGIFDMKSTEAPVRVMQHTRAPVAGRREGHLERAEFIRLPVAQLLHMVEAETVDEAADIFGDNDALVAGDGAECFAVKMVKVGMGHQHEVDRREVVDFHAGLLDALDDFEPLGPVGIDEHAVLVGLDEERRVADPCDANLTRLELWKDRLHAAALPLGEQRGDDHLREEISFVPSAAELHVNMVLGLASCGDFSLDELPDHA